jgi:hypothetical protein
MRSFPVVFWSWPELLFKYPGDSPPALHLAGTNNRRVFSDQGQNRSEHRKAGGTGVTQLSVRTPPRASESSHLHLAVCVGIKPRLAESKDDAFDPLTEKQQIKVIIARAF